MILPKHDLFSMLNTRVHMLIESASEVHVYKDKWEVAIGEELECVHEQLAQSNAVDRYVVAVSSERRHNRWPLTEDVSSHLLEKR